jgi:hypothetical protein
MDINNAGHAKVRLAKKEDIKIISDNMREDDINEVWASNHLTPFEALRRSFESSELRFTVDVDGVPQAMFGVVNISSAPGGCIWLLSTKDFCKISKVFLKRCRGHIAAFLTYYVSLENWVSAENKISIRWLHFCHADIDDPAPYGAEGKLFRHFKFVRKNG